MHIICSVTLFYKKLYKNIDPQKCPEMRTELPCSGCDLGTEIRNGVLKLPRIHVFLLNNSSLRGWAGIFAYFQFQFLMFNYARRIKSNCSPIVSSSTEYKWTLRMLEIEQKSIHKIYGISFFIDIGKWFSNGLKSITTYQSRAKFSIRNLNK